MAAAGSFFAVVSCVIRGYHVYKEVWSPNSGESFMCFAEEENIHDRNTKGNDAMTKLEGFPNFRVGEEFEVLERFKARSQ